MTQGIRGVDMIAWLQQFHELHLDKSRLESSYDEVGNAFTATSHSQAVLDWHAGVNWRRRAQGADRRKSMSVI